MELILIYRSLQILFVDPPQIWYFKWPKDTVLTSFAFFRPTLAAFFLIRGSSPANQTIDTLEELDGAIQKRGYGSVCQCLIAI